MLHVLVYNMSSDYMIKRLYCFFFFNPCSGVEITINAKLNLDRFLNLRFPVSNTRKPICNCVFFTQKAEIWKHDTTNEDIFNHYHLIL